MTNRITFAVVLLGLLLIPATSGPHDAAAPPSPLPGQSATLLADGHWLLLGGEGPAGPVGEAWLWDVRTQFGTRLTALLHLPRAGHTATVLPDGSVLVLGGLGPDGLATDQAERFDPGRETFEALGTLGLRARAFHTATLLTDGRLVVAGGVGADGTPVVEVERWDPDHGAAPGGGSLGAPRSHHRATLLGDGRVLLRGGVDAVGEALAQDEIYDPARDGVVPATAADGSDPDAALPPRLTGSAPTDGATGVPVDLVIALRFSKPLRVNTVTDRTVLLSGPNGLEPARVVAAEGGRLAFVTPDAPLDPGARYTLSITGPADVEGFLVPLVVVQFTTEAGAATGATAEEAPTTTRGEDATQAAQTPPAVGGANAASGPVELDAPVWTGERRDGKPYSRWQALPPLQAAPGVTALAGQVLKLDGQPLPDATLRIGARSARTDATGRFLLTDIPAGTPLMFIDGSTASRPGRRYARFMQHVEIAAGVTTVLPYTIWLTVLDTQHMMRLPVPTPHEIVVTNPTIPGLEMRIPAGVILRDRAGQPVREVGLTRVPVDRPPYPLPEGTDFFFTPELLGAAVVRGDGTPSPVGVRFVLPNYKGLAPGVRIDLWDYHPVAKWRVYGMGTVTRDGRQIVPDPGVELFSVGCSFPAGAEAAAPASGHKPGEHASDADPVNRVLPVSMREMT